MCGRFLLDADYEALIERYQIFEDIRGIYEKRIEIFPAQYVWEIHNDIMGKPVLNQSPWGIDAYISGKKKRVINARFESLPSKPFFKGMSPCVLPASGYYEWDQKTKEKYCIRHENGLFLMAGLYVPETYEVVIVTCDAGESTQKIHNRMPVIIEDSNISKWLDLKIADIEVSQKSPLVLENQETYQQLSLF